MRCFVSVAFTSNRLVSGGSYAQAFVRASYAAMRDCKDAALIRLAVCFLEVLFLGGRGAARPLPWRARRRSTYGMVQLDLSLVGQGAARPLPWRARRRSTYGMVQLDLSLAAHANSNLERRRPSFSLAPLVSYFKMRKCAKKRISG